MVKVRATPGRRFKWARVLVEPNRSEFARKMNVDPSTVRKFEDDARKLSAQSLYKMCHFLRITEAYVYDGDLSGVDPHLAAMLAVQHPELKLPRNPGKDTHASTRMLPMALDLLNHVLEVER